jgi:hypothetical protein
MAVACAKASASGRPIDFVDRFGYALFFTLLTAAFAAWLTVSVAAIADAADLNCIVFLLVEEHAVVAAAEPEARERRFELFHVPHADGQVTIDAVENLYRNFAVYGAEIGSGIRRPNDG